MTLEQTGRIAQDKEPFYLFELGRPLSLQNVIQSISDISRRDTMRLTTLEKLETVRFFTDIVEVYTEALQ